MKLMKVMPELGLAIGQLDDGEEVRFAATNADSALATLTSANAVRAAEKAQKQAEKEEEKADKAIAKLESKALKALPDILAHLAACDHAESVTYRAVLMAALERLV